MKKIMLIVVVLFITACGPTATQQMDVYGTAVVAQGQLQISSMMLTGTADAPLVHITETSAAFVMEQARAQATSAAGVQTQSAAITQTAISWTPTPNATATLGMANVIAIQTAIDLETKSKQINNTFYATIIPIFLIVILLMIGIFVFTYVRDHRHKVLPSNVPGDKPIIVNTVTGEIVDVDVNPNYSTGKEMSLLEQIFVQYMERNHGFRSQLPQITAERQDRTKERDQFIDLKARVAHLPKALTDSQGMKFLDEPTAARNTVPLIGDNFLLPSWDIINGWDGKKGLPYYTARGLETIDIDQYPHLSAIGMTGMGKSRRFFRPLIACALAAGHRVIIIGKSADYWPFEGHPNATVLKVSKITEPEQALRYASILESIVAEMNRRDDVLTAQRQSTWTHAGHNRTFIVLDELGNALRLMDAEVSRQSRIWVEGLVSEGRKAGFNIVLANQRATGMASILSQTGKAIFRVERDEERAHKSLLGASDLRDGYFLAKFGASKLAGAFEPTDDELIEFLKSRPVSKLEDEGWIDGKLVDPKQVTDACDAESLPEATYPKVMHVDEARKIAEEIIRIEDLDAAGKSEYAIIRELWGVTGGGSYARRQEQVREVLAKKVPSSSPSSPILGSEMGLQAA